MSYERLIGMDGTGAVPVVTTSEPGTPEPLTTTHQVGGGTLSVNWGGVAMLGLTGAFFWWYWKKFMPAMERVGERERGL